MNIPLNKPFLPEKKEYVSYINKIWQRNWLTNHGPMVQQFQNRVADFLNIPDFIFMSSGTISLQVALKALNIQGEVITTPYSYVATTSSIVWEGCRPVFADVCADTLNIDPERIKSRITENTSCIVATHIYGYPCDVEAIQKIADQYKLRVIYDAAHCFGVTYNGDSILKWGDASILSFHATKLLHTVEGGGFYSNDESLMKRVRFMMNFGHDGPYNFKEVGINGKNSEFHAAMGLCNLSHATDILNRRKNQVRQYKSELEQQPVQFQKARDNTEYNYAYFPVIFDTVQLTSKVEKQLSQHGVETRRYFTPSLNKLNYVNSQNALPVAEDVSGRVLCLPLFYDLTPKEISYVCTIVSQTLEKET